MVARAPPAIGGWVVLDPGVITYNYRQFEGFGTEGYGYAKGTYLNDLLTDSILIPSLRLAKFGETMMNGTITFDDPKMTELINEMREHAVAFKKSILSFLHESIHYPLGEHFFLTYSIMLQEEDLEEFLPKLSENVRQKHYAMNGLAGNSKVSVGEPYMPFVGKTPDGKYCNLSDIVKSKQLVLLDFWASWCTPCIKEMPILTQLYENYKDKGLEIVGVSLDNSELPWKKAIEKHNMLWVNIINDEKSNNIATLYGIYTIPHTVLINSNGEIISDKLRGQELVETVKNLLD